jgi:F0F1-type ATP synthase membrane subunit c/vacuolar-type H+-ATPase subunit K
MSGAAALLAFVALVAGLGRGRAVAALVLAVLANPYLLTQALAAIGRLWM